MSINRWVKKENVGYVHNELFDHKKEGNPAIFDNIGESWGHYAKWNKSNTEKHCMFSLTCGILINKTYKNKKENGGCHEWLGEMGEGGQGVQTFGNKINKSWGYSMQPGDHS